MALRYFNAAGTSPEGDLGEDHRPETHLIPLVVDTALGLRPSLTVFGNEYPTPDGTAIRDYVHVCTLADAHLLAIRLLASGVHGRAVNLGNERGHSVREVVAAVEAATGHPVPVVAGDPRSDDPPVLGASNQLARRLLAWAPRSAGLVEMVESALTWRRRHPGGYPHLGE